MTSRRNFLATAIAGIGIPFIAPALASCSEKQGMIENLAGPDHRLGHRLRTMNFPAPTIAMKTDVVIVGGGISGLSAARFLKKNKTDFILLELESQPGGNSMGGKNTSTAYPWGAHYLPLPNSNDKELISFLEESKVITGYENAIPTFNEFFLCFEPKERLYINHFWQDGLIPNEGVPEKDRQEIDRFLELMHRYKEHKGADGKDAFTIPLSDCSHDPVYTQLDSMTARHYLTGQNFSSPYLIWYVNYCCLDDYGSTIEEISAWAMIHYFASRKGVAANASTDTVLTWPEGNYWLANQLRKTSAENIHVQSVVFDLTTSKDHVELSYFDVAQNRSIRVEAKSVILATPQFVNKQLLKKYDRRIDYSLYEYSTWMVSNIRVEGALDERRGEPLCWDNVLYGSTSLGYIHANHQDIHQPGVVNNTITYYAPQIPSTTSRQKAYENKFDDWKQLVFSDLKQAHPDFEKSVREMNCWVWGHGMVKPKPDFLWGSNNASRNDALNNRIFFAHSDLSGISIFEEAFCNGYKAAKAALAHG